MGTAIVAGVLLIVVYLIVRKMVKAKKAGKSIHCSCGCDGCGAHCHDKK